MRLDKYLTDCGIDSRSNCKKYIRQGRVTVNDCVEKNEARHVSDADNICFDNTPVVLKSGLYLMFYKPSGCVCALRDAMHQTVIDYFPDDYKKRLLIAGRLDKDTVGLLLITNDGNLAHRLLSPKHHVDKCYFAKVQGNVTKEDAEKFAEGVNIGTEDEPEITMPGKLDIIKSDDLSEIRLTIQEGKFHQVKRMFQAVGKEVVYLKRERMGSLILDDNLAEGEYRMLTEEELKNLLF